MVLVIFIYLKKKNLPRSKINAIFCGVLLSGHLKPFSGRVLISALIVKISKSLEICKENIKSTTLTSLRICKEIQKECH